MDQSSKLQSTDRILQLTLKDGKQMLSGTGLIDPRLFTGENKLHAYMESNGLWSLRYEHGVLPQALREQFTSFTHLMKHVQQYFIKRNIIVKEVIS